MPSDAPSPTSLPRAARLTPVLKNKKSWIYLFLGLLVLTSLAWLQYPAKAYSNDTHFGLTYFLARSVGFSGLQAQRIASACAAVDSRDNPDTEPEHMQDPLAAKAQRNRVSFHALLDQNRFPHFEENKAALKQALAAREATGAKLALFCREKLHNPGVYLHFLQDTFSHWGYGCEWGHFNPNDAILPRRLPFGSRTDYLSYDTATAAPEAARRFGVPAARNDQMVLRTLRELRLHFRGKIPPAAVARSESESLGLLQDLKAVNPYPKSPLDFQKEQDYGPANQKINQRLVKLGFRESLPAPIRYKLTTDAQGQIIPTRVLVDAMALYGSLRVVLPPSTPAGTLVTVRTTTEGPLQTGYALATYRSTPGRLQKQVPDCPVGIVRVAVTHPGKARREWAANIRARDNTFLVPRPQ